MAAVRLLAISGSARTGSLNRRLTEAVAAVGRAQSAEVGVVDLRDLALPLYDGDIEAAGLPDGALALRRLFASHDAVIFSTPEYNGFVTPLLLNALDWTTRVKADGDQPSGLEALGRTVAGVVSASPGALGGLRSAMALRGFLAAGLAMQVVPASLSVGKAHEAFAPDGRLADERQQQSLERVVRVTLQTALALRPA